MPTTKSTFVAVADAPRKPTTSANEVTTVVSLSWIFRTEGEPACVDADCVVADTSIDTKSKPSVSMLADVPVAPLVSAPTVPATVSRISLAAGTVIVVALLGQEMKGKESGPR